MRLRKDVSWNKGRLDYRSRYLMPDEIVEVKQFYEIADKMLTFVLDRGEESLLSWYPKEFQESLSSLELARLKAEANILDETDEDSGM